MNPKRYLVTVISKDDSVFTYGVTTIGGNESANDIVKSLKNSNSEYFIHSIISDEKADHEIVTKEIDIPKWVNAFK